MANPSTPPSIDDAAAVDLWGRVIKGFQTTNRRVHGSIRESFDLNEAEIEALLTLHRAAEHRASMVTLARATAYSSGGFTKIADKLADRNLVVRVAGTYDRRVTFLELTPAGVEAAAKLARLIADINRAKFINVLGPDRARMVADAMTELYQANGESKN